METITLITGGNKGIGRETARRLKQAGHTVLIGARDPERGRTAAAELGVGLLHLDITDQTSVDAAATRVRAEYGRLDVLVNNAAVNSVVAPLEQTTAEEAAAELDANLLGALRVTNAFVPLLQASPHARVVNVSSTVGSFAATLEYDMFDWKIVPPIYAISKTALTMLTLKYSRALPGILVNAADPGYTETDLNDHQGTQTVTEGTDAIVHLATLDDDGPTGTFINRDGAVPW
jgi:NAD(P)-dependent dehydrogenase (short-subunit alcohol dehydrogenase family)